MNAGTYTGIEAVSNGLPILRELRNVTGKRTMLYMAVSLAFIAGGILVGYLLTGVEPQPGTTLNAVPFERLTANWNPAGFPLGTEMVAPTLKRRAVESLNPKLLDELPEAIAARRRSKHGP